MNIYFDFPLIWCLEEITVYAGGNQLCYYWSEANNLVQPTEKTETEPPFKPLLTQTKKILTIINP